MSNPDNPEDIFDRATKTLGGRLTTHVGEPLKGILETVRHRAQSLINLHTTRIPRTNPRHVHFDLIDNPKINAVAFTTGVDFIGLNDGTIVALMNVFQRMLYHSEILPWIGGTADAPTRPVRLERLITSTTDILETGADFHFPKDPVRANYARALTNTALDFLIAHELSHITNGHVDLVKTLTANVVLEEMVGHAMNSQLGLTLQTLEMDADAAATQWILVMAFESTAHMQKSSIDQKFEWAKPIYSSHKDALFLVLFSLYVVFKIFDKGHWDTSSLAQRSHPPPSLRYFMISALIPEILKKHRLDGLIGDFQKMYTDVFMAAEKACALIVDGAPNLDGLRRAISVPSRAHVDELLNHWKVLRPHLDLLKRGGNLAP